MNTVWKDESYPSSKVAICVVYTKLEVLELLSSYGKDMLMCGEDTPSQWSKSHIRPHQWEVWLDGLSQALMVLNHFQQRSQTVLEDNTVNADMLSLFQMLTLIVLRACKLFFSPNFLWPIFSKFCLLKKTPTFWFVYSLFSSPVCVYGTGHLEQPQISSTRKLSKTAHMECMISGVTISTTSVYWYQERPGQAIQHLLHIFSNNTVKRESGILLSKFEAHMTPETSTSTLTVHNVQEQDSATYYCALWDVHGRRY